MTVPPQPPVYDYPDGLPSSPPPSNPKRRLSSWIVVLLAAAVAVAVILTVAVIGHRVTSRSAPADPSVSAVAEPPAVCAPTDEGRDLRAQMFYTQKRYLSDEVEPSEELPPRWCVFTTTYDSQMWWAAVYVGEDNPLYQVMVAKDGAELDKTRATVIYQQLVPIKFAYQGWIGFTADGYSRFATKALAIQVWHLADRMNR